MPPSAIVASKAMANDPRAEPKYCERVPYVVVAGPVGARLMDLVSMYVEQSGGGLVSLCGLCRDRAGARFVDMFLVCVYVHMFVLRE